MDIVGDAKIVDLKDVFVEQGFSVYEQLYRMNRIGTLEFKEIDTPMFALRKMSMLKWC